MAQVLKNFQLNPESDTYITIETRESGIINFILNLVGLDPSYHMKCNNDSVDYESSSLSGSVKQILPLSAITEVTTGIHKPIKFLIAAVIFLLLTLMTLISGAAMDVVPVGGIAVSVIFYLIIAVICIVKYVLNKQILFAVKNGGDGYAASISCLPAVIAGERIDSEKFIAAVNLLRDKVNAANNKRI